jgi:hypothetical protein
MEGTGMNTNIRLASIVFVITCFFVINANAADFITAGSGANITLADLEFITGGTTVSGGPTSFTLSGNLTISALDTLAIAAGEKLWVIDDPAGVGYAIVVEGRLAIEGADGNPASIKSFNNQAGSWRGVFLMGSPTLPHEIDWCEFEGARTAILMQGINGAWIRNCSFGNLYGAGVAALPGTEAAIINCSFAPGDWGVGVTLDAPTSVTVEGCVFAGGGGGVGSYSSTPDTHITNNSTLNSYGSFVSNGNDQAAFETNLADWGWVGAVIGNSAISTWSGDTFTSQSTMGMAIVNEAAPVVRMASFENIGSVGGIVIDDNALPDLGDGSEDGNNSFALNDSWDLVNFSPLTQVAIGNSWSFHLPDYVVWDWYEDEGDADGSGERSGRVFFEVSRVDGWLFF